MLYIDANLNSDFVSNSRSTLNTHVVFNFDLLKLFFVGWGTKPV